MMCPSHSVIRQKGLPTLILLVIASTSSSNCFADGFRIITTTPALAQCRFISNERNAPRVVRPSSCLFVSTTSASSSTTNPTDDPKSNTNNELFNADDIDPSLIQVSLQESLTNAESGQSTFEDDDEDDFNLWVQEDEEDYDENYDKVEMLRHQPSYLRDEDDILAEREDRLYKDYKGMSRIVETCVLVGVENLSQARRSTRRQGAEDTEVHFTIEESMKEMRELIKTAGMELVGEVTQRLNEPNPRTYIGTGKLQEAEELAKLQGCSTLVFDAELSPGQQRTLENQFNKKILQNDFMVSEVSCSTRAY